MRLIDADEFAKEISRIDDLRKLSTKTVGEALKRTPTIEAAPVVHGYWKETDYVKYDGHGECIHYPKEGLRCSNCYHCFKKELLWNDNFCPNCGAKMDGKRRSSYVGITDYDYGI